MLRLWRCAGEFGMSHRLILLLAVVQSAAAQNNDDRRHTSPSSAAIGFVVAAVFLFVLCCGIQRRRVQRANKPAYIAPPLPLHTNSHMHTGTPYAPGIHGMQYGQGGHSPYGHTPPLGGYPFNPNAPGPNAGSEYPPAAAADWAPPPYVKDAEGTEGPGEAGGQQYAPVRVMFFLYHYRATVFFKILFHDKRGTRNADMDAYLYSPQVLHRQGSMRCMRRPSARHRRRISPPHPHPQISAPSTAGSARPRGRHHRMSRARRRISTVRQLRRIATALL
ncbi:hypothetical protein C8R43DRAFT_1031029 [Mycena crocata]|nr:hypothetical protein C8R43DRAFT_1031029 [Mycena crocata]